MVDLFTRGYILCQRDLKMTELFMFWMIIFTAIGALSRFGSFVIEIATLRNTKYKNRFKL